MAFFGSEIAYAEQVLIHQFCQLPTLLSLSAGVTVETVDRGVNGCLVKTITKGGAVDKDGHLQVGDYIVSINNESLRHITNAQARAILRRTSLLSTDIR